MPYIISDGGPREGRKRLHNFLITPLFSCWSAIGYWKFEHLLRHVETDDFYNRSLDNGLTAEALFAYVTSDYRTFYLTG